MDRPLPPLRPSPIACASPGCGDRGEFVYQGRYAACGKHSVEVQRAIVAVYPVDGFTPFTWAPVGAVAR